MQPNRKFTHAFLVKGTLAMVKTFDVYVVDLESGEKELVRSGVTLEFANELIDNWHRTDSGFLVVLSSA